MSTPFVLLGHNRPDHDQHGGPSEYPVPGTMVCEA
jgi:hypothetical protein